MGFFDEWSTDSVTDWFSEASDSVTDWVDDTENWLSDVIPQDTWDKGVDLAKKKINDLTQEQALKNKINSTKNLSVKNASAIKNTPPPQGGNDAGLFDNKLMIIAGAGVLFFILNKK